MTDSDTRLSAGHDTSGPNTDSAMTRSEERVRVMKEIVQTGRARLVKYVVTETKTFTVEVSREEVRLDFVPLAEADQRVVSPDEVVPDDFVMVLSEERVDVTKRVVPVERVRLVKTMVTEQQQVSADLRKERIALDVDDGVKTRG